MAIENVFETLLRGWCCCRHWVGEKIGYILWARLVGHVVAGLCPVRDVRAAAGLPRGQLHQPGPVHLPRQLQETYHHVRTICPNQCCGAGGAEII